MSVFEPVEDLVPPSIRRRSAAQREQDGASFIALRSLGIDYTQALSGRVWTDYNLHDPGVTILEQLCYALTELTYRADLPVADHLCRPDGVINYERQALFRPDDILRCRPTTANDYRRVLLDAVPELADARFIPDDGTDAARIPGLHRLSLRLADQHKDDDEAPPVDQVRVAYRAVRTVGEDLDDDIASVTPTLCTLSLTASISGMREPADILAEIYRDCAAHIAGLAQVRSLVELVRARRPIEEILDGPVTLNGLIEERDLPKPVQDGLAVSELRPIVQAVEGVVEVISLGVKVDVSDPPRRPGEPWAPCLRVPGDGDHEDDVGLLEQVILLRRGVKVSPDARAVASRHAHHFQPRLAAGATRADFEKVLPPPHGRHRQPTPFRSVQEEFPVIYGLGRRAAGGAGTGRVALARVAQLKGYLTLFDQLLANTGAQLVHIRDLFTVDRATRRSYWRHVLNEDDVEGVRAVQAAPPGTILRKVYVPFDHAADRRSRALDHLLALYGETCTQNTLRQFLDFLDSRELARTLLLNKAEYLRWTVLLGRDRAAGFDTAVDLWRRRPDEPEPTTGLQVRIGLLLGFKDWRARPLTSRRASGARRRTARLASDLTPAPTGAEKPPPAHDGTWALTWPDAYTAPGTRADARERFRAATTELRRLRRDTTLHADLLAHAVNRERFRWLPAAKGPGGTLLLIDDAENRRDLGAFDSERAAADLAWRLRRWMLCLNSLCEGLHVVEHILLRPRAAGAEVDPAFHGLRATFVFPNWTARTSRPAFQTFAKETIDINCPAHVAGECLWLDFAQMRSFEAKFATWTSRLRAHVGASDTARAEATERLDAAAADLAGFVRERLWVQGRPARRLEHLARLDAFRARDRRRRQATAARRARRG